MKKSFLFVLVLLVSIFSYAKAQEVAPVATPAVAPAQSCGCQQPCYCVPCVNPLFAPRCYYEIPTGKSIGFLNCLFGCPCCEISSCGCAAPAPACGCDAPACGCGIGLGLRIQIGLCNLKNTTICALNNLFAPSCSPCCCEIVPACGCVASAPAPACGCAAPTPASACGCGCEAPACGCCEFRPFNGFFKCLFDCTVCNLKNAFSCPCCGSCGTCGCAVPAPACGCTAPAPVAVPAPVATPAAVSAPAPLPVPTQTNAPDRVLPNSTPMASSVIQQTSATVRY